MSKSNEKVSLKTNIAILVASLLPFFLTLMEASMNVTFPEMVKIFQQPLSVVQWITTGYLLVVTITMCTTGYLIKRFNLKYLFITSGVAFLIGLVLCSIAPSFWILLLGRLISGIGMGLTFPLLFEIIFVQVPKHKVGAYVGVPLMVIALARALGPTYGGQLSSISWRLIYLIVLPFVAIIFLIGLKVINQPAPGEKKHFSFMSLFFISLTLFAFVLAANQFGVKGSSIWYSIGTAAIGIISFMIFLYVNNHGNSQLLLLRPFRLPVVSLNLVNWFLVMFINVAATFIIPIYAISALHLSPLVAGLILLPGSIVGGILAPVAGWVYDKFGAFLPIFFGLIVLIISAFLFATMTKSFTPLFMTIVYIFLRVGINSSIGNFMTNAEMFTPKAEIADMNAVFNILLQYAGAFGTAVLAAVLALYQNQATTAGQVVIKTLEGGKMDFIILLVVAIIAMILELINWNMQRKSRAKIGK